MAGEARYIDTRRLTPVEEALRLLKERTRPVGERLRIPVWEANGMVLASDVKAPHDWPPQHRAAYDGYAVRSSDTPGRLRLVGSAEIGSRRVPSIGPGEAAYVTTGSYLPIGADSVVPEEHARIEDSYVIIEEHVEPWSYIDRKGSIAREGELLLERGTVLTILDIAGLLEAAVTEVEVYRRVQVAIVSTGNELIFPTSPEDTARRVLEGQVVATTGSVVEQFLIDYVPWAEVVHTALLPDNLDTVAWYLERLLPAADIILLTGGTGPSRIDLFYRLQERLGGELVFRGLYVIGGKPTSAYVIDGKPVIGLSGYPISALHATIRLVYPLLAYLGNARRSSPPLPIQEAILKAPIKPKRPRPIKVVLRREHGVLTAEPLPREHQRSSATLAFTLADGIALTGDKPLQAGDRVRVLPYREPREG